jgi:DNA-binding NtrC family response regulator
LSPSHIKAESTSSTSPTIPVIGEILAAVSLSWKDWLMPAQMTFVTPNLLSIPNRSSTDKSSKEIEKTAIQQALMRNNWKKMVTARELGIDKNTLRRKINRLGMINKTIDKRFRSS